MEAPREVSQIALLPPFLATEHYITQNMQEALNMEMAISNELDWATAHRDHYLTDVKEKVLWEDRKSGAKAVLLKFPVGIADKRHYHEANQIIYGLSGEFETGNGDKVPIDGVFGYFPKGEVHGETKITKEATFIFYWDGPAEPKLKD